MIYLLHGEDKTASYGRLSQILKNHEHMTRQNFSEEDLRDDLYLAIFAENLLAEKTVAVAQNFIRDKKLVPKDAIFKNIPKDKILILWETSQVTPSYLKSLAPFAQIETFKPEPLIFRFLDSLAPNSKTPFLILEDLQRQVIGSAGAAYSYPLIWHLASRILLLTTAKLGASPEQAASLAGRALADWQWQKIKNQAALFDLKNLKSFFAGTLKADLMAKSGKSDLDQMTLASFLLLKYLTPRAA